MDIFRGSSTLLIQCFLIAVVVLCTSATNPFGDNKIDYASSTEDMKVLVKHEYKIVKVLSTLAENPDSKIKTVLSYLDDFKSSLLQGIGAEKSVITIENTSLMDGDVLADQVVNHALMTFRCIRRIVHLLPEIQEELANFPGNENFKTNLRVLKDDIPYPVYEDLDTAIDAIIRLKQTYNVAIDDIVPGNFNDLHTHSGLTARQCYEIGSYAAQNSWYSHAIDFLDKTLKMKPDKHFPLTALELEDIESKLNQMIKEHDHRLKSGLQESDYKFDSLPHIFHGYLIGRNSSKFLNRKPIAIEPEREEKGTPLALISRFQKLCRGEDLRSPKEKKKLRCYLESNTHPSFIISPLKVEVHHEDPLVLQIYDVLSNLNMTLLRSEVKSELRRSRTVALNGDTKGDTSPYRTSSNSWIADHNITKFQYLGNRIGRMVNFDLSKYEASENLQIANYAPGGHYVAHTDAIFEKEIVSLINQDEIFRGDRIATFMIYLSEVVAGGNTVFPKLKISVKPIIGSAVFWYNLYSDGSINDKMLHAGCPVLYGQKWIANKWIRSNEQMFLRKCPLVLQYDNMHLAL